MLKIDHLKSIICFYTGHTKVCDRPKQSATTNNYPQKPATTQNHLQPPKTSHNRLQTPTTTYYHLQTPKKPKLVTHIHFDSNTSIITEYIFDTDTDAA